MANASTIKPCFKFFGLPSSSSIPEACETPMKVEIESKRSVKRIEMIAGRSESFSAPRTSSFRKTLPKSGALKNFSGAFTKPASHATIVTRMMPERNASELFFFRSQTVSMSPKTVSRDFKSRVPSFTKVTGSATIRPAFLSPMKVRKIPMPAAVAILSPGGIARAMVSRIGVALMSMKSTPAQKIMPSAACQGTFIPRMMVNVKKALMPMPGATAKGSRAYNPISSVITKQTRTVAVSTPLKDMPVPCVDRIEGLTTTM